MAEMLQDAHLDSNTASQHGCCTSVVQNNVRIVGSASMESSLHSSPLSFHSLPGAPGSHSLPWLFFGIDNSLYE